MHAILKVWIPLCQVTKYYIQNALCSFCLFCDYWFEINNNLNMHLYIHMCYKCLACESNMASSLNLLVGNSVGCPLNYPLFPFLKEVGCPLSCPLYLYNEVVGSLICKILMGSHLRCPLSFPQFPYMEIVGGLICMAKLPWAAHSTAHWAAHFFIFGSSGLPTELPTELPTVSKYGSSGWPNLQGKIPTGDPWAAHDVAHVQLISSEVGGSPVSSVWVVFTYQWMISLPCQKKLSR